MMTLTLPERRSLTKAFARKYRFASKRDKRLILNQFIEYTGFNRSYAARILRKIYEPKVLRTKRRKPRKLYYDEAVRDPLERIWAILDHICGKRVVSAIPEMIRKLEQFNEIEIDSVVREKLHQISASTIDRILRPAKRKLGRKGTSMTKGGNYLIDQIPIKTFGEWDDSPAGFIQVDLAAHNGGDVFGGFMHTMTATDVATTWTTCTLVADKTKLQMLKGLILMKKSFPFSLKAMHSDNGAEFINETVKAFAEKKGLEFTRSRPYKKNDNAHVEQKNYSVVRRNTGYLRYDKPSHAQILKELYTHLNLFVNYFQPTMVLVEKHRKGAKVTKKYDQPKTPYQRLLERKDISEKTKIEAEAIYQTLNPAELKRKINACQAKLIKAAAPIRVPVKPKKIRRKKQIEHTLPNTQRKFSNKKPNPFLERQRIEEMRRAAETVWDERKKSGT